MSIYSSHIGGLHLRREGPSSLRGPSRSPQQSCGSRVRQLFLPVMSTLVECVPNFSEGRDKAKVDAIVEAMKIPGVYLARSRDGFRPQPLRDHPRRRTRAIQEAAIRGVGKAAELIDLTKHPGAHPRMGAADVVPFIPIEGVTIEDCVAMARRSARRSGSAFKIPVYLYEAAATTSRAAEPGKHPPRTV